MFSFDWFKRRHKKGQKTGSRTLYSARSNFLPLRVCPAAWLLVYFQSRPRLKEAPSCAANKPWKELS